MLLIIASAVVAVLLPSTRRRAGRGRGRDVWEGMDWTGTWSLAGGVTSAMLVLSVGPIVGWTSPAVITAAVAAVALAGVFVWQGDVANPLVPKTYWRRRNFMFPMGAKSFSSFAYFGGFFLFPLLMEQVYGYSVSQVGFISVARPLVFAVGPRRSPGTWPCAQASGRRRCSVRAHSASPWSSLPRSPRRRGCR